MPEGLGNLMTKGLPVVTIENHAKPNQVFPMARISYPKKATISR
ncbi:MAG TPA: hypothetical protein VF893_06100 [Candidatus Bathyarchaeia archaeon]